MSYLEKFFRKNPFSGSANDIISEADVIRFIENQFEENMNLDYKQIDKINDPEKLSDIVASFANNDGGLLILGVSEKKVNIKSGTKIYPDQITWGDKKNTREMLEDRLYVCIKPWIINLRIYAVRKQNEHEKSIFLIDIPRSNSRPHMSVNGFYKRKNYSSDVMDFDEIKNMFMTTHILREDIINNIIMPIYGEINFINMNLRYETHYNPSYYNNDLNIKYRYLLDTMDDKKLVNEIDKFFSLINKRDYLMANLENISNKLIKEGLYNYQKQKEPTRYLKDVELNIHAKVFNTNLNEIDISIHPRFLMLYDCNVEDYVQTMPTVKDIMKIDYWLSFPDRREEIQRSTFSYILKELCHLAEDKTIFRDIRQLTDEIKSTGNILANYLLRY